MESSSTSNTSKQLYHYRLKLQYNGTNYNGWQAQNNARTIQNELNKALNILSKSDQVKSVGSGRTDTGVHALGQIVRAQIEHEIPSQGLLKGLNAHLPDDIRVLEASQCQEDFHPVFNAQYKEYNYLFSCTRPSVFMKDLMAYCPYELDLDLLQKACDLFVGEYDFKNFYCVGTKLKSTVRTIYHCSLEKAPRNYAIGPYIDDYYVIRVVGNGFLKQMVRMMVGSLWNVARGHKSLEDLRQALHDTEKGKIGSVAPACGLYLKEVVYDRPYS